ncbi:MAG: sugar dehydrogenase complex small subunit [Amaricoccus sp.]
MGITRRAAIVESVAAVIAAAGPAGFPSAVFAQAAVSVDQFLQLSERLTGSSGLDADTAKTLLGGFLATDHGSALAELVRPGSTGASPLADAIVAAWYSGVYETGRGTAVSDFNGALVWNALSFTKPFGSCGGEIGYWADPPEP